MIALNRGDAAGAIRWLERAVEAAPGAAPLHFNLFQALEQSGALERGLESLDRALTADPLYVPAIVMKADLLGRLGRAQESLSLFRALIASGPRLDDMPEPVRLAFERGHGRVRAD